MGDVDAREDDAPGVGATVPLAMPNSVVLPAPFGPMMPSASPSASARSSARATTTAPKRLEIFSKARMAGMQWSSASRAALYHASTSPALIPAHSASKTRVNALMLGIQGPQSVGPRSPQRGPRDASVAGCPSRGRADLFHVPQD